MTMLSAIQLDALPGNSPNQHDIPVPAGELVLLNEEGFDLSTTAAIEVSARSNGMSPSVMQGFLQVPYVGPADESSHIKTNGRKNLGNT